MKQSMVQLVGQALDLTRRIVEAGGELTPEIEAELAINAADIATKADGYAAFQDNLEVQIEGLKARRDELVSVICGMERVRDRLKDNLKAAMAALETTEIKGDMYRWKTRPSKSKLVLNESVISSEWKRQVTIWEVDKDAIRSALEAGQRIEGASLVSGVALNKYLNRE